jgi:hypothetical protein
MADKSTVGPAPGDHRAAGAPDNAQEPAALVGSCVSRSRARGHGALPIAERSGHPFYAAACQPSQSPANVAGCSTTSPASSPSTSFAFASVAGRVRGRRSPRRSSSRAPCRPTRRPSRRHLQHPWHRRRALPLRTPGNDRGHRDPKQRTPSPEGFRSENEGWRPCLRPVPG